ncbi:MAG: hypothetical protein FMNOHCHN_01723 [Ignavibacteriaceae bacterium]|nr:hypothetical protein [Ignavibacteriaceae bacterium]
MYFFYLDESGEKNPGVKKTEPYVMVAVGLHEYQWKKFEHSINDFKLKLLGEINRREGIQLELADAEVRSSDIRIPTNRLKHKFLRYLTPDELSNLVDLFYSQFEERHIQIISAVIDKSRLDSYMDTEKLHRKTYELLLERVENFLKINHPKQQAIFVLDNTSKQLNKSLAMKHSYFLRQATSSRVRLNHIVEIPFFVESYLSNGVQLADLCAYNIYRVFHKRDADYQFFIRMLPFFTSRIKRPGIKGDGLKVFPDNHQWEELINLIENKRARLIKERAQK